MLFLLFCTIKSEFYSVRPGTSEIVLFYTFANAADFLPFSLNVLPRIRELLTDLLSSVSCSSVSLTAYDSFSRKDGRVT